MGVEGLDKVAFDFGDIFKVIIPNHHAVVVKKIAFQAFTGMVMKTPVDTGRARANWGVRVGAPYAVISESTDKQPIGSAPGAQIAQASTAINGAQSGKAIYISNGLSYILALNEGHSKQGAHMVESTVMEIKSHYGI